MIVTIYFHMRFKISYRQWIRMHAHLIYLYHARDIIFFNINLNSKLGTKKFGFWIWKIVFLYKYYNGWFDSSVGSEPASWLDCRGSNPTKEKHLNGEYE